MTHTVEYIETGYLYVIYDGELNSAEAETLLHDVAEAVENRRCLRLLGDFRKATLTLSIDMVYGVPNLLMKLFADTGKYMYMLKRALVASEEYVDKYRFFETVSINRSQNVRVFVEMDKAREWLMAD